MGPLPGPVALMIYQYSCIMIWGSSLYWHIPDYYGSITSIHRLYSYQYIPDYYQHDAEIDIPVLATHTTDSLPVTGSESDSAGSDS
jgi:hypothetical protein